MADGLRLRAPRDVEEEYQPSMDSDDLVHDKPPTRAREMQARNIRRLAIFSILVAVIIYSIFTFQRWRIRDLPESIRAPYEEDYDDEDVVVSRPKLHGEPAKLPAHVQKRDAVVAAFKHAWKAYERDAFGSDEYHPIRRQGENFSYTGGIGYMIVDSIDTMHIMGLDEEFKRARQWVAKSLSFDRDNMVSTFETTIRIFGGLLSTYYLTEDAIFLSKAKDLGDRLAFAFNTPSGLALSSVNLKTGEARGDNGHISTAEAATLQLEFRYLSHLTGNVTYWHLAEKVISVIKKALWNPPLVPVYMDPNQGSFIQSDIRLGSRADSYYEYLLKDYLQTSRTEEVYRQMYDDAMTAIHDNLLDSTPKRKLLYTVEMLSSSQHQKHPKQDHLVCFLGGSLMLGATDGAHADVPPKSGQLDDIAQRDWKTGQELIKTCMATHETKTGLAPEIAYFRTEPGEDDWYVKSHTWDSQYLLRPETVESLFLGWRLTGDQQYRDWGWQVFSSIEKHAKIADGGYATVQDVDEVPAKLVDKMETFFIAETLKYLYLLFADSSVLPLTDVVFNTEAHPLPIFKPTIRTGFH